MRTRFNLLFRFILIAIFGLQITACTTKLGKGFQHLEDHNYPEALVLFEEVAEQDVRIAGILAADLHISDYQIPRNLEKSQYYLNMALKAEYGRYDQAYDYYIPLIKAYQLLADKEQTDKSLAFEILNYEKYQEYSWPLSVLAHCNLVGYGTKQDTSTAKMYFEKSVNNQTFDGSNLTYAWWLSVFPDSSFRDPEKALSIALEVVDDEDFMDKPLYLDTLAATYAINNNFDQAQQTQQKAVNILDENILKYPYMDRYKATFASRLEHYKQGKPWIFSYEDIERCGYASKRCLKK